MPDSDAKCRSIAELGRRLGVSRQSAHTWTRHRDWPQEIDRKPPWSPAEIRRIAAFTAALPAGGNPTGTARERSEAESAAELEIKQQRARYYRIRADKAAGALHDTEACQRRILWAIQEVATAMDGLAASLPAELRNADPVHWESIIRKRCDEIRERFAEGQNATAAKRKRAR